MQDIVGVNIDSSTGRVTMSLSSKKATGINKLIQMVVFSLMTSPGSDVLEETSGSGMPDMVAMNIDPSDMSEIYSQVSKKVSVTQAEIVTNQLGLNLDPEEKLKSLSVTSIVLTAEDEVTVQLSIENEAGRTRVVVL